MTTKLNENSVKTHIEIEGVVLTTETINQLSNWQAHDNEHLRFNLDSISEAVCFIGSLFYSLDAQTQIAAAKTIADLSIVRDNLKSLKKP